jgi:hypothetical protein
VKHPADCHLDADFVLCGFSDFYLIDPDLLVATFGDKLAQYPHSQATENPGPNQVTGAGVQFSVPSGVT